MRRVSLSELSFSYDPDDPGGFRCGQARLGRQVAASESGATVYELPPGEAVCPYHYEYGEEEWLLVLAGEPSVRTPEGTDTLKPSDLVFFPKGPDGAHQVRNDGTESATVLMWSTVVLPTGTAYPDSGKVGLWTGDDAEDMLARRSSRVDYFDGELD